MTPATLNDRRISSLVATIPLVVMAGLAGPVVAACTRTGVGRCSGSACEEQAVNVSASPAANVASPAARREFGMRMLFPQIQRQVSRGGRVVELRLSCQ